MASATSRRACSVCDQQDCAYLPSLTGLQVGEPSAAALRQANTTEYDEYCYQPCERCDAPFARGTPAKPLCIRCQHLRLLHFLVCTEQNDRPRVDKLRLGTYGQIRAGCQEVCEFCMLIYHAVQINCSAASYLLKGQTLADTSEAHMQRTWMVWGGESRCIFEITWTVEESGCKQFFTVNLGCAVGSSDTHAWNGFTMAGAGRHVSWDIVKKWLFECDSRHHHDTGVNPTQLTECQPRGFMMIDVEDGCVIDAPPGCSYIALSYVWGSDRSGELRATAATMSFLRSRGSLGKDTLPATIWDSMTVCQELRVRYLWVDRLCIIQDSTTQKMEQIRAMSAIFTQATLTICALGSPDSHTGLWGTENTPRSFGRGQASIADIKVMQVLEDDREWRYGHAWWRRAWTYQEYLLSRRTLLFSPWQVTFECDRGPEFEALTRRVCVTPDSQFRNNNGSRLAKYQDIVQEYNERVLTWPDDVYDAFLGVFKAVYGSLDQFVWGLPAVDFDKALLWCTESLGPWRRGIPRVAARGVHLASWSWVSASGRTVASPSSREPVTSVAQWNFWDQNRGLRPILSDGMAEEDGNFKTAVEAWCAWATGCIEAPLPEELQPNGAAHLLSLSIALPNRWPTYSAYRREAFYTPGPWMCDDPVDIALVKEKAGRVLLRSTTNTFRVQCGLRGTHINHVLRALDGKPVGELDFHSLPPTRADHDDLDATTRTEHWDFVALSVETVHGYLKVAELLKHDTSVSEACKFKPLPDKQSSYYEFLARCSKENVDGTKVLSPDYTIHDDEGYALFPPPALSVMMTSRHGDASRREGLGYILLAQWIKTMSGFQTIVLE